MCVLFLRRFSMQEDSTSTWDHIQLFCASTESWKVIRHSVQLIHLISQIAHLKLPNKLPALRAHSPFILYSHTFLHIQFFECYSWTELTRLFSENYEFPLICVKLSIVFSFFHCDHFLIHRVKFVKKKMSKTC